MKAIYLAELRQRCSKHLQEALHKRIVFPAELEDAIWQYYRKTSPSLQEFYSRYTPEWEMFYDAESLSPGDFLLFLKRMLPAFRKRYALTELDVPYYIGKLEQPASTDAGRKNLQEFFLNKWHRLLTAKEYDYQYHHIASLCNSFALLKASTGMKTETNLISSRIRWLLYNHPELYRKVMHYEKTMEQNRHIHELVRILGKRSQGEKKRFDPLSGAQKEQLVRHATQSDIEGITLGNDLNHLLPIEYCYFAEETLRPVFMQRYTEKRLQMFDSRSQEDRSAAQSGKREVSGQGPFVICLDTSGSMEGKREQLAKSAVLAIARLTESTHRKCYIINFSEETEHLLVKDLYTDLPVLVEFLNHSFGGGTSMEQAVDEAVRMINSNGWHRSDVVMISDFEMPPISETLMKQILELKRKETAFYALVFGTRPEMDYLNLCDRCWNMDIPG